MGLRATDMTLLRRQFSHCCVSAPGTLLLKQAHLAVPLRETFRSLSYQGIQKRAVMLVMMKKLMTMMVMMMKMMKMMINMMVKMKM